MLWLRGFPLVSPFAPSTPQERVFRLFADFTATMPESDCFNSFIVDSDYLLSSAARHDCRGELKPSQSTRVYVRPGFLRQRGARQTLTVAVLQVLPSALMKTSALRTITFRCSIIPATRAAADASTAPSRVLRTARDGSSG